MRNYKKIILYTDTQVMYKMENDWYYVVDTGLDSIGVFAMAGSYTTHQPHFEEGIPPAELLEQSERLLKELPLTPVVTYQVPRNIFQDEKNIPKNPYADT